MSDRGFDDVLRPVDVDLEGVELVLLGVLDPENRGEVDDRIHAQHGLTHRALVENGPTHDVDSLRELVLHSLDLAIEVKHDHVLAEGNQLSHHLGANETRPPVTKKRLKECSRAD